MLSQRICRQCIGRHRPPLMAVSMDSNTLVSDGVWNGTDDGLWEDNLVDCPCPHLASTRELPPSWCPYSLEHVLETEGQESD